MIVQTFRINLAQKSAAIFLGVALTQIYFPYLSIKFLLSSLILSYLFSNFRNTLETLIAISLAFAVTALITQIPGIKEVFVDKNVAVVSLAALVILAILAILSRMNFKGHFPSTAFGNLIPPLVMLVVSYFWSASRNLGGLSFLGRTEDNAAWLMGLSFGLKSGSGINYVSDLGWAGGPTLGVFNAVAMSFQQMSMLRPYTYFDNIDTIIRSFGLLLILIIGTSTAFVFQFAHRIGRNFVVYVPVAAGTFVLMYMGCASVMRLGHYSFLLAIWLMISALSVSEVMYGSGLNYVNEHKLKIAKNIVIAVFVITASMSWRAITPVALLVAFYFVLSAVYSFRRTLLQRILSSPFAIGTTFLIAGTFLIMMYIFLGGDLKNGLNLDVLTKILTIEGGTATVSVLVLLVLLAIAWYPLFTDTKATDRQSDNTEMALPLSLVCVFVLMMLISYLIEGHSLHYAVYKFELLLAICMIPLAMKTITGVSSLDRSKWMSFGSVLLVITVFLYDGSLSSGLSYPGVDRSESVVWATVAEKELRTQPERRIVCLNTSDPDKKFDDYVAYTCNRILIGLQGLEGKDDYEDWTRLGMWLTDTTRLENLPSSYYESLTFIVLDPKFSRTGDETVMRAINSIQWEKTRVVDLEGNLINFPSPS